MTRGPRQSFGKLAKMLKQPTRYWTAVALVVAVGLVVIASAVGVSSLVLTVRNELQAARQLAPQLKGAFLRGDKKAADETLRRLSSHTSNARAATDSPLWTIAGALPWLGANFRAMSEVSTAADDVTRLSAAPLASVLDTLDWNALAPGREGIDLSHLSVARPKLVGAAKAVALSADRLNRIDLDTLIPEIAEPLAETKIELGSLQEGLNTAADVASIAPEMLGSTNTRRYLLMVQNNAEVRATGGIAGAVAVLSVDKGRLNLASQTSAAALGRFSPPVSTDAEQELIYTKRLGSYMQDVNLTPDFPTSAHTAAAMWETRMGSKLDGVISVDPIALGYILEATGPVQLMSEFQVAASGGLPNEIDGKNAVQTLLSDVYAKISDPKLQDAYFANVAQRIFEALSAGKGDPVKLLTGLNRASSEGRILVWSSYTKEQSIILRYPLSGSVSAENVSPAQFGVYFNDGTGAKMDYHVKRTVQLLVECPANGYREVKVRITSANTAPRDAASSLPSYVTGGGSFGVPPGSVQTNVTAYGPVQSNIETASVGEAKAGFASFRQDGRPVGALTIRLAPGQSKTVEFSFGKIVQSTAPQLSVTPTVQPLQEVLLKTQDAECSPVP